MSHYTSMNLFIKAFKKQKTKTAKIKDSHCIWSLTEDSFLLIDCKGERND